MRNLESYNLTRRQYLRKEVSSDDFLGLRGEIAEQLSGGGDEVVNYVARKSARLWLCSQKYDRHFIDGVPFPGFYETTYATFKIKGVVDSVASNFSNISGLMLVDSCAWGANYALKMSEVSDRVDSDVDFEVILGRKEDWDMVTSSPLLRQDSKFIRGFSSFRQLHEQGLADYFSHKVIIKEVETSLHFTPISALTSLCRFSLSGFEGISTFREIRVVPKTKPSLYNLSNFRRRRYPFDCVVERINDLIFTYTPKEDTEHKLRGNLSLK